MTDGAELPGLHWGIKASFLDYIARMPDARGTVSSGATPVRADEFVFEPAADRSDAAGVFEFRGEVRFAAHFGMLYVRIADPVITLGEDVGELSVRYPFGTGPATRLRLVTFTPPAAVTSARQRWSAHDVRLTAEGSEVFGNVYSAGERFEPLMVVPDMAG